MTKAHGVLNSLSEISNKRFHEPTCVNCGCTNNRACVTGLANCAWVILDPATNRGLCSACSPVAA